MELTPGSDMTIERLGTVSPISLTQTWRESSALEPVPIILWRGPDLAAALYYEWEGNGILGTYSQKIGSMDDSFKTWLRVLGSDYPIKFWGKVSGDWGEASTDAFDVDHIQVADLDGDGVDELVLPRHQGVVEVYNLDSRVQKWQAPRFEPKYYAHDVKSAQTVAVRGRATMYFVFRREPYSGASVPDDIAADAKKVPTESLVEVSGAEIRQVELQGLPGRIERILGVGIWERPKSAQQTADAAELLAATKLEDLDSVCFSRHALDGRLIEQPRESYVDLAGEHRLEFEFLPGRELLVARGTSSRLVFIWPDKKVNWLKTVEFDALRSGSGPVLFRGLVDRQSEQVKALLQQGNALFVVDADGRYYRRQGDSYRAVGAQEEEQVVPWLELETASPDHRLAQVRLLEGDDDAILVLENRHEGLRTLDPEEVRSAAARFLAKEYLADAKVEYEPTFEKCYHEDMLPEEYRGPDATIPLRTVEDIERLLPEYYRKELEFLASQHISHLENELTRPLDMDVAIEEPTYRNIPEYKRWLGTLPYPDEMRLRIVSFGHTLVDETVPDTVMYTTSPAPGIPLKWVTTRRRGNRFRLVLPLVRTSQQSIDVGFYLLSRD